MTSLPSPADEPAARIAALFDAHCGFVCRVLRHHGVHEAALDDAVQDVFVTAHRRWSSFEGRSSARSWLYGIARRIAFRYRRSAEARARRFVAEDDAPAEGIDEPFARAHAAHSLAALLHELDVDKRTVFVLAEVEGMTAPEVAEALGIPLGTVYSRLRAAWQVLGKQAGREEQRLRRALPSMRAAEPSPERRRQMWSLVMGGFGLPREGGSGTAVITGWLAQAKWIAVGAALGAGLLGARAAVVASQRGGEASVRSGSAEPEERSRTAEDPAAKVDAAIPSAASPPPSAATERLPLPSPPAAASPVSTRTRTPPSSTPTVTVDAPAEDALAAELALLRRAREALREGRVDDALAWLDQHARRFPRGQLVDERRALEVEAGRSEEP